MSFEYMDLRLLHLFLFLLGLEYLHLTWHNDHFMLFWCLMYFTLQYFARFPCLVALVTTVKRIQYYIINKLRIKISEMNLWPGKFC